MKNEKVTIKIPRRIYMKIQHIVDGGSGFNSPTDFIVYVLRDVLSERAPHDTNTNGASEEFSPEELKALKQKLRNLGYLD